MFLCSVMLRLFSPLSADEAATFACRALERLENDRTRNQGRREPYPIGCTLGTTNWTDVQRRCQPRSPAYKIQLRRTELSASVSELLVCRDIRDARTLQAPRWVFTYAFRKVKSDRGVTLVSADKREPTVLVVSARHLGGLLWTHMVLERARCSGHSVTWRTVRGFHFLDGEESFSVMRDKHTKRLVYCICSVSAASHWLARLASPYVRLCQDRFQVESVRFLQQRWEDPPDTRKHRRQHRGP